MLTTILRGSGYVVCLVDGSPPCLWHPSLSVCKALRLGISRWTRIVILVAHIETWHFFNFFSLPTSSYVPIYWPRLFLLYFFLEISALILEVYMCVYVLFLKHPLGTIFCFLYFSHRCSFVVLFFVFVVFSLVQKKKQNRIT